MTNVDSEQGQVSIWQVVAALGFLVGFVIVFILTLAAWREEGPNVRHSPNYHTHNQNGW